MNSKNDITFFVENKKIFTPPKPDDYFRWSNTDNQIYEDSPFRIYENPKGDGDCQFTALCSQLQLIRGINISSDSLRLQIVTYLKKNPFTPAGVRYDEFCIEKWAAYVAKMSETYTYGDNITLQAAAILYDVNIIVISSLGRAATAVISKSGDGELFVGIDNLYVGHQSEKQYGDSCHYMSLIPPPASFSLDSFLVTCKQAPQQILCDKAFETSTNSVPKTEDRNSSHNLVVNNPTVSQSATAMSENNLVNNINQDEVSLLEGPFQPKNYVFPRKQFSSSKYKRSFNAAWFSQWPWLHYRINTDSVLCFTCVYAIQKKLMTVSSRKDNAFMDNGFCNWKKATEKFSEHAMSLTHKLAEEKILFAKQISISSLLNTQANNDQILARTVLKVIFSTVKYLGRQCIAFRGDKHDDGNFWHLVLERGNDVRGVAEWLNKRNNWMSDTIQNEIIQSFAHSIQRTIAHEISESTYVGLTADGTTDVASDEQFSVNVRFVDSSSLNVHECFLGFYNSPNSTGDTLFSIIKDVFLRFSIPMNRLAGYAFDGASNMSGHLTGVKGCLKNEHPSAVYVHCANHSLDLVLQEVCSHVPIVIEALQFVKDTSNIIRESAKRTQLYESMFGPEEAVLKLVSLCPTRWCVRSIAFKRFHHTYAHICETLRILADDKSVRMDARAKISGLLKQSMKAQTYYGIVVCDCIFSRCEIVAKALQSPSIGAAGAEESIQLLIGQLTSMRTDEHAAEHYNNTVAIVEVLGLSMPKLQRKDSTRLPLRFRQGGSGDVALITTEQQWRKSYFEVIDLAVGELTRRFDQEGLKKVASLERLLLKAATVTNDNCCKFQKDDSLLQTIGLDVIDGFDEHQLHAQLQLLSQIFRDKPAPRNISEIVQTFQKLDVTTRNLFNQVERIIVFCLAVPVSVAGSERTFSALRRLKTWLRSNISQSRLTHLALMHVHKKRLDDVNIEDLMNEFILKTPQRIAVFGN